MKKILLTLTFGLIMFQINAQNVDITSSSSSPTAPTDCADLLITADGFLYCTNFQFDSTSYSIVGNVIEVGVYYTGSLICFGAISPISFTKNLGNVPDGTYTVNIKAYIDLTAVDSYNAPNITVLSCCPVVASYTSSATVGCTDDTAPITFTSTSTSATTNNWYVNDVLSFSGNSFYTTVPPIGTYNVKLVSSDGSCTDSITKIYNVYASPTVSLAPDTTICSGQSLVLNAGNGFSTYAWTNSTSTTATATVTAANTYKVTVTDANGCKASDSLVVSHWALPIVNLGNDTAICSGQNLILNPGTFVSYNWNTSATSQTINATTSFNYGVTVTDANGCQGNDNINVLVNALPNVTLAEDTFKICQGQSVNINAGNFSSYLWNTNETTSSINVNTPGPISVTVTNANNCSKTANSFVKLFNKPVINFGSDTLAFCTGNSITLNPGTFNSYVWSNAATSSTIVASVAGDYNVTVTNENNCSKNGSVYVKENALPVVNLGADNEICLNEDLTLNGGTFTSYLWNEGSIQPSLTVSGSNLNIGANTFILSATNSNGCSASDEIIVTVKDCNVGISSTILEKSISIYPNPASKILNIKVSEILDSKIKIYNVIGKVVMNIASKNLNSNSTIDISNLNNGVYFIEITVANKKMVNQFMKIN